MDIEIIKTNTECCCNCKGTGSECNSGYSWIYCILRLENINLFDADCGELLGCNHFIKPSVESYGLSGSDLINDIL